MPRSKSDVEAALEKKGFEKSEGDHHYFVYFRKDGKKTMARTKTSHTKKMKDIPDILLSQMAKQVSLTKQDFLKLVDCPMSRDEYELKLSPSAPATGTPTSEPKIGYSENKKRRQ